MIRSYKREYKNYKRKGKDYLKATLDDQKEISIYKVT